MYKKARNLKISFRVAVEKTISVHMQHACFYEQIILPTLL